MDQEQIERKLEWLDQERKRDAEQLQRLKTQIDDLNNSIGSFSKRMEELSAELSRVNAIASRVHQFDETLSKHRSEVSRRLKDSEDHRTQKEKQLEALRKSDEKKLVRNIDEIRRDLGRVEEINQELQQRQAEDVRLNNELRELSESLKDALASIDDQNLRLVAVEEMTTKDSKKVNAIQTELAAINRRAEDLGNSADTIEDRTRKLEVELSDLRSSDRERTNQLEVWMDEQRMKLVDFEKEWSDWAKRFELFEKEAREVEEKIQAYDQTHRSITKMQGQLEDLLERLERRITEVGEMQRLSEERIKQDWTAFEADETKKWSTFKLSSEERWKEHQRFHDKLGRTVSELEELRTDIRADIDELMERETRKLNELIAFARQWLKEMQ